MRQGVGLSKQPKENLICKHYINPNLCFWVEMFELFFPVYIHIFNVENKSVVVVTRAVVLKPVKKFAYDWHSNAHVGQLASAADIWQVAVMANGIIGLCKGGGTRPGRGWQDEKRRGTTSGGWVSSLVYNKRKREGKRKKGPRLVRGTTRQKYEHTLGVGAVDTRYEDFSGTKQLSWGEALTEVDGVREPMSARSG